MSRLAFGLYATKLIHTRDDSEGKRVKRVCEFYDERYGKNRSITDVDWSPKVRTYAGNQSRDVDRLLVSVP